MTLYLTELMRYLAAQSWQIAVLTLAVAAATWALRHRTAHIRYLLWLIVLAKCLVPPLYMVPVRILPERTAPAVIAESSAVEPVAIEPPSSIPIQTSPPLLPNTLAESGRVERATPAGVEDRPSRPLDLRLYAGIAWIVGAGLYLAMNLLRAVRGRYWLAARRRPLPDAIRKETEVLLSTPDRRPLPPIWVIDDIGQPFVWGLLHGSIYVPSQFLEIGDREQRKLVLAHELSHVLRFDAAVNALQTLAQGLFWFHPFVWWANREIRREREKCCDEMAVAQLGTEARAYCHAVVETLASAETSARPVPSLAVAGPARNLEERIKTMLRPGKRCYRRLNHTAAAIIGSVALVTIPVTFAVTTRAEAERPPQPPNEIASHEQSSGVLPEGWSLDYDDGMRDGGTGRTWLSNMASDLASLEVLPRPKDPQDRTWKNENYDFELFSSAGESVGTINIRRNFPDRETWKKIVKPDRYTLRYRRDGGKNPDNFWMCGESLVIDLRRPGMYTLRFRPKLGQARITGALAGCYALNFERIETPGVYIHGTIYQYPPEQYTIDGIPPGKYRLSAVKQANGPNIFVSQAEVTIAGDETTKIDMSAPPQGTCSLRGKILGRPRQYRTPWEVKPHYSDRQWFVLLRNTGSGPIKQTRAYEAQTMDSRYVIRGGRIAQETDDTATYSISGIAPGQYTVTAFEHPWYAGCTIERQQSQPLTLKAGEEATLDFDLTERL